MDQLGVVTLVLVLSTLLTSLEDFRRLWRKRFGKRDAAGTARAQGPDAPAAAERPGDLVAALLEDLESDDERRISRAMSLASQVPGARLTPRLVQMLRHPREEVSARAARALLHLGTADTLEPLYLYFNARGSRA